MLYEPAEPVAVGDSLKLPSTDIPEDTEAFARAVTKQLEKKSRTPLGDVEGKALPSLVLYTPALENAQLRCPREEMQRALNGTEYMERVCKNGSSCVALSIEGGPGKPLMESLYPSEYAHLLEHGTYFGGGPESCVLCRRNEVAVEMTKLSMSHVLSKNPLCQTFYNNVYPAGDPQVYRESCCLLPDTNQNGSNGLFAPVVEFKRHYYQWKPVGDDWYISQEKVLYLPGKRLVS